MTSCMHGSNVAANDRQATKQSKFKRTVFLGRLHYEPVMWRLWWLLAGLVELCAADWTVTSGRLVTSWSRSAMVLGVFYIGNAQWLEWFNIVAFLIFFFERRNQKNCFDHTPIKNQHYEKMWVPIPQNDQNGRKCNHGEKTCETVEVDWEISWQRWGPAELTLTDACRAPGIRPTTETVKPVKSL